MRRMWLLAAVFVSFISQAQSGMTEPVAAPDFTLKAMTGENVRLSEQAGNVVLLNFWASWCGPCRKEMPLLDELQQKYAELGFVVIGVNLDENSADAKGFLAQVPVSFPVLLDAESKIGKLYQVDAMPTTVIIDRDGNKRYLHRGYVDGDLQTYQDVVKELLRE